MNLEQDPGHALISKFFKKSMLTSPKGKVLEIGSRARSGISRRGLIPEGHSYCGFDIVDGPNVDVCGDIHKLSSYFPKEEFDFAFSMSVFEHLAMPWKAALELNKILKTGALMLHATHQTWPLHETPWDFWRYSSDTWRCIFNKKTGFKVVDVAMGEPGHVRPNYRHAGVKDIHKHPVYLMSSVICEKSGPTELSWDVDISEILESEYPY